MPSRPRPPRRSRSRPPWRRRSPRRARRSCRRRSSPSSRRDHIGGIADHELVDQPAGALPGGQDQRPERGLAEQHRQPAHVGEIALSPALPLRRRAAYPQRRDVPRSFIASPPDVLAPQLFPDRVVESLESARKRTWSDIARPRQVDDLLVGDGRGPARAEPTTRSASVMASTRSWVTSRMVCLFAAQARAPDRAWRCAAVRRARRTARRAAGPWARRAACGRGWRACACRRTARAGSVSQSRPGRPGGSSRGRPCVALGLRPTPASSSGQRHVVEHGAPGQQVVLLRHVADVGVDVGYRRPDRRRDLRLADRGRRSC